MSEQQQQPTFQYSVKIDTTAKGAAVVTVHCFGNDAEATRRQAVEQYTKTIEELKGKGLTVATAEGGKV
jgi:hypothetical protein